MIARRSFGVSGLADPEEAFGFACRHLLFPGGIGLLIASVLAANMAGCSAFMVDSGALFTRNFYRKYLVRSRMDSHYLWVGRLSGMLITLAGALYAVFLIQRVLYSFLLTETMATFMGISIFGGILWRRANRWGAVSSLAAAMAANFLLYHARGQRLDHWDPNVFLVALSAGVVALVGVSLLTPEEPPASLASFFARLQTPATGPEEEAPAVSAEAAAKEGRQLILVNLFHLQRGAAGVGLLRAYRTDLSGFAIGWLIALSLILAAWLLFHAAW
jgi:Na+/proline symporter